MQFEKIFSLVGNVPFISKKNARFLYDFIIKENLTNILELGIGHGSATCYMAAALHELGKGKVTAVDLMEAGNIFKPSAEDQIIKADLSEFVTIKRMQTGYTWFLHDEIVRNTKSDVCSPVYDLCIIDGPKNWTIDGAAFFFADKLLKKNGWIIFDDYNWTYDSADKRRDSTDGITHRSLSEDEKKTPHIREVFELLVKQHPHYGNLLVFKERDWVLAQKNMRNYKSSQIAHGETYRDLAGKLYSKLKKILKGT